MKIQIPVALTAASANNICTSQTPTAAAGFTLNGSTVSGGVATICTGGCARQVLFTTAADETATPKTATVTGTNATGNVITDTVTLPNISTVATTKYFKTVTAISITANAAGNITVGTNGVGGSRVIGMDTQALSFSVGLGVIVSGTVNYTVQHTFDDIQSTTEPTWLDHATLAAQTSNKDSNYAFPVNAIRLKINSGTGTATFSVIQGHEQQ